MVVRDAEVRFSAFTRGEKRFSSFEDAVEDIKRDVALANRVPSGVSVLSRVDSLGAKGTLVYGQPPQADSQVYLMEVEMDFMGNPFTVEYAIEFAPEEVEEVIVREPEDGVLFGEEFVGGRVEGFDGEGTLAGVEIGPEGDGEDVSGDGEDSADGGSSGVSVAEVRGGGRGGSLRGGVSGGDGGGSGRVAELTIPVVE